MNSRNVGSSSSLTSVRWSDLSRRLSLKCVPDVGVLYRGIVLSCELGLDCEAERKDFEICLTQPESELDPLAWLKAHFSSGRSVARQPAIMQAPASIVDQIAMLTAFQKKSSI